MGTPTSAGSSSSLRGARSMPVTKKRERRPGSNGDTMSLGSLGICSGGGGVRVAARLWRQDTQ
jgi:hypothetical protein